MKFSLCKYQEKIDKNQIVYRCHNKLQNQFCKYQIRICLVSMTKYRCRRCCQQCRGAKLQTARHSIKQYLIVGRLTHAGGSDVLIQHGIVNSTMSSKMQDLEDCIKFLTDKTIFLQKSLEKSCQQVDQLDLRVKTVEGIQCH